MINWCEFSPKQLDFICNSNAKLNIADGAVRSGKTIACTVRWLDYVFEGPPGDLCMLGKSLGTLKRNVLNDLFDIAGPKHSRWIDRQQGEFQLFNRRVYAIGAANEEAEGKIRGATFAGAYCDEANLYPESVWMQLQARLSIPGAKCFANCNPDSPYHWFYKKVLTSEEIKSKKRWQFLMDDNYSLSEEYKIQLASSYSGVYRRRFIEGEWCVAEGLIYDAFDKDTHLKHYDLTYIDKHAVRWFVGCDQGTSTVTSWSLMVELNDIPHKVHIHKVAEFYYDAVLNRKQLSDEQLMPKFKDFLRPYSALANKTGGFWKIFVDPAASSWDAMLSEHHFNRQHADNDVINGIRIVSSLLSKRCYTIDPSCVNTVANYETYAWDPNAQLLGIDKPIKKNDHACDSDRYALVTYLQLRKGGIYNVRMY